VQIKNKIQQELSPDCGCGIFYDSCIDCFNKKLKMHKYMPTVEQVNGVWRALAVAVMEKDLEAVRKCYFQLRAYKIQAQNSSDTFSEPEEVIE